ncbi:hypothetical protein AAHH79_40200, partial [Burkholderia pseudomallei]
HIVDCPHDHGRVEALRVRDQLLDDRLANVLLLGKFDGIDPHILLNERLNLSPLFGIALSYKH